MRPSWILFGLLLGMCVILGIAFFIGEIPNGHGFDHARLPNMQQGGSGIARHEKILWVGWALGLAQVLFFVTCLALGARRYERLDSVKRPLIIGSLLYAAIFTGLMLAYRAYITEGEHALLWIFPAPTAFMIYGLWPVPLYFVLLYIWGFDRWIYRPEDEEKFQQLMESRREREEGAA